MKSSPSPAPDKEVCHATVFLSGRVQGVGFRYHTLQIAKEFDVSGYVRNLDDGRVQVEAEGAEAEVRGFVAEVQDRLAVFIRKAALAETRRPAQFKGFTIGY